MVDCSSNLSSIKNTKNYNNNSNNINKEEKEIEKEEEINWIATTEWVESWKKNLPLQTIMRVLQILVPQVEKICIDK